MTKHLNYIVESISHRGSYDYGSTENMESDKNRHLEWKYHRTI